VAGRTDLVKNRHPRRRASAESPCPAAVLTLSNSSSVDGSIGSSTFVDCWTGRSAGFSPFSWAKTESKEFVSRTVGSYWHPVGTCAMGVHQEAVVDPSLCVYGTTNLRVADASIMPTITSGNTNAPTIVIAERAAQMIIGAK
jgi:choline dehydrogenase